MGAGSFDPRGRRLETETRPAIQIRQSVRSRCPVPRRRLPFRRILHARPKAGGDTPPRWPTTTCCPGCEHVFERRRRTSRRRRGTCGASLCPARRRARRRGPRVVRCGRARAMRPAGSPGQGCRVGEERGRAGGSRRRLDRPPPTCSMIRRSAAPASSAKVIAECRRQCGDSWSQASMPASRARRRTSSHRCPCRRRPPLAVASSGPASCRASLSPPRRARSAR